MSRLLVPSFLHGVILIKALHTTAESAIGDGHVLGDSRKTEDAVKEKLDGVEEGLRVAQNGVDRAFRGCARCLRLEICGAFCCSTN